MENKEKKYLKLLCYSLSITVVFDAINGFLNMYISETVSNIIPLIRLFLVFFYLLFLFKIDNVKGKKTTLIAVLLLISTNLISIFYEISIKGLIANNIYSIKLLSFYILSTLLIALTSKKYLNKECLFQIIKRNSYLIVVLIIVPTLLGISRQTYSGSDLGSSGFFISNNSTNYVLIIATYTIIYIWSEKSLVEIKDRYTHSFIYLALFSLWLQGSKTSYVFLIIFTLYYLLFLLPKLFYSILQYTKSIKKGYFKLTISMIITVCIVLLIYTYSHIEDLVNYIYELNKDFISRQQYQMKIHDNWISYLSSGRTDYLMNVMSEVIGKYGFQSLVFGIGIFNLRQLGKITEMDFVDIIITAGILGLAITYSVLIKNIFISASRKKQLRVYLSVIFTFTFLFSFFAGHVFVDIISSTILSVVIALNYIFWEE